MLRLLQGFPHAFRGLAHLVKTERHARFHLAATIATVALGLCMKIQRTDWLCLTAAITIVWMAEAFNSAIERLADRVTKERDPLIGQAKDLGAAAVLIAAIAALAIGVLVFTSYM